MAKVFGSDTDRSNDVTTSQEKRETMTDTMQAQHTAIECVRDIQGSQYCGKSWKSRFTCPECGRKCWQNLNFLGRRRVMCNGTRFTKELDR